MAGVIPNSIEALSRPAVNFQALSSRLCSTSRMRSTVGQRPGWLLDGEADVAARVLALEFGGDGGRLGTEIDLLEADLCPGDAGQVQQVVENVSHVLAGGLDPLGVAAAVLAEGIGVILDQHGAEPGQRAQRGPQVVREGVARRIAGSGWSAGDRRVPAVAG